MIKIVYLVNAQEDVIGVFKSETDAQKLVDANIELDYEYNPFKVIGNLDDNAKTIYPINWLGETIEDVAATENDANTLIATKYNDDEHGYEEYPLN